MSVSPSQISTWRDCKRKFAFTYLAGLPRPPETKAQRIGIALHAKAETFIKTGVPDYGATTEDDVEAARLLPAILPYLPKGATAEQKIKVTIDGVDFGGRYDWLDNGEVGDLKTTSSLRWAKTEAELAVHPQPLIYAKATGAESCRWVYVQTKGATHVREVRFKPDFKALPELLVNAKEIVRAWADRGDPNTYEPNLGACEAYGGCPFKAHCKVDSGKRLAMLMGITAPKAPTESKEPPDMTTSFDALMAAINPPMQTVTRTEELPPVLAINPPPMTPAEKAILSSSDDLETKLDKALALGDKPKRKRRTKAEMAAANKPLENIARGRDADTGINPDELGSVACDPQPKTDPAPAQDDKPIGLLLISTTEGGHPEQMAEDAAYIFNSANIEVAEQCGLEDYRQVDFGKGAGLFAAAVVRKIKDIRPDVLYVDGRSPQANVCLTALIAMSKRYFRGH